MSMALKQKAEQKEKLDPKEELILDLKRKVRSLRKSLLDLTTSVTHITQHFDQIMAPTVWNAKPPFERGRLICQLVNALDMTNQSAKHFALGVPLKTVHQDIAARDPDGRPAMMPAWLLRPNRETCNRCGAVDKMNWHVSNELWLAVASPEWVNEKFDSVLCLACFDDLAVAKNIAALGRIESLFVNGDKETLVVLDLQEEKGDG